MDRHRSPQTSSLIAPPDMSAVPTRQHDRHPDDVRIALVGAGLVGRRHAVALAAANGVSLAAIADPDPAAEGFAATCGVAWYASLSEALERGDVDGVVLATPNRLHLPGALEAIGKGVPVLVEKPLASSVTDGEAIVAAAERAGVPLATGHHRRHNPLIAAARERIEAGALGRPVAAHAFAWLRKPDAYFDVSWRREPGGGPVLVNLIHDIDLLHHLVGPVTEVSAMTANIARAHAVEDTAVAALRFANGALGTMTVSDATVTPWSWELSARENPAYPPADQPAMMIAGTRGSLSVPDVALWSQNEGEGWWDPIRMTRAPIPHGDPLVRQAEQFAAVVRGMEPPLASGRDGLAALRVVEAILESAASRSPVTIARDA